jgi:hypothetical protein
MEPVDKVNFPSPIKYLTLELFGGIIALGLATWQREILYEGVYLFMFVDRLLSSLGSIRILLRPFF